MIMKEEKNSLENLSLEELEAQEKTTKEQIAEVDTKEEAARSAIEEATSKKKDAEKAIEKASKSKGSAETNLEEALSKKEAAEKAEAEAKEELASAEKELIEANESLDGTVEETEKLTRQLVDIEEAIEFAKEKAAEAKPAKKELSKAEIKKLSERCEALIKGAKFNHKNKIDLFYSIEESPKARVSFIRKRNTPAFDNMLEAKAKAFLKQHA